MADGKTRLKSRDPNGLTRHAMQPACRIPGRAGPDGEARQSARAPIVFPAGGRTPPAGPAAGLA